MIGFFHHLQIHLVKVLGRVLFAGMIDQYIQLPVMLKCFAYSVSAEGFVANISFK